MPEEQVGTVVPLIFKVLDASGAAVTGLGNGDFTVTGYQGTSGATVALSTAFTEIGSGFYAYDVTMPSTTGELTVYISENAGKRVTPNRWQTHVRSQTVDTVFASVQRPVAAQTSPVNIGSEVQLRVVAKRFNSVSVSITDSDGNAVDLSGYTNLRFTVRDEDHGESSPWTVTSGFTNDASGNLAFDIPETFGAYDDIELDGSAAPELRFHLPAHRPKKLVLEIDGFVDKCHVTALEVGRAHV